MPRPPETDFLKCRFCTFTVLRYRRFKNGKTHHGHMQLQKHVLLNHYDSTSGEPGPYYTQLLNEKEDWLADPATLGEDMEDEEHPFDRL
jgi:hypothetical protein